MRRLADPPRLPGTGLTPSELLARAFPLAGTPGQAYVERRSISLDIANSVDLRFDPDFGGRPAIIAGLWNREEVLTGVHGRYLHTVRGQNKMLTIGMGGGVVNVLGGWRAEPMILVEGLFDALSLAVRGVAPWLPAVSAGRVVWLAFDATKSGNQATADYHIRLGAAAVRVLRPPGRCKDWSTAISKRGAASVDRWVRDCLATSGRF
jgi:hypothetical protein